MKVKQATRDVMLGYWIHHQINQATMEELDNPQVMFGWIQDFGLFDLNDMHNELRRLSEDYKLRYTSPSQKEEIY